MKKITIKLFTATLFVLISINSNIIGQTVSLNISSVNNVSISNGTPISIPSNSTASITLSSQVNLPAAVNDSYPGTIKVYYQKNSNYSSIVATGGNGGNLLFYGGTSTSRSFSITLNSSDFDTTGGYIYAEYQTYTGVKHKSSNYPVIKTFTSGGGNVVDVRNITNTLCCNQTIRYGDKPNIITSSQIIDNSSISEIWTKNNSEPLYMSSDGNVYFDHLQNSTTLYRTLKSGNYINNSNTITLTVVPSPILTNIINTDLSLNPDGFSEFSILNGVSIGPNSSVKVNLNILQDPFHTQQRGDSYTDVDSYRWEFAVLNSNYLNSPLKEWTVINNENSATLSNFNPSIISSTENQYFLVRRIAIYQNISKVSNELKLFTRPILHNNTVCCDQALKITSSTEIENPLPIIGSTPIYSNPNLDPNTSFYSISYQWQNQTNDSGIGVWSDINGATSKDYLPLTPTIIFNGRSGYKAESTHNYRRIAKFNYTGYIKGIWTTGSESCYSNHTSLTAYSTNLPLVKIYPNPTSSVLNIESIIDLTNAQINIINAIGINVNSNNYSLTNPNLASIDVSNLITGTYFIQIVTQESMSQLTFIKN